jgi:hypothetical protein
MSKNDLSPVDRFPTATVQRSLLECRSIRNSCADCTSYHKPASCADGCRICIPMHGLQGFSHRHLCGTTPHSSAVFAVSSRCVDIDCTTILLCAQCHSCDTHAGRCCLYRAIATSFSQHKIQVQFRLELQHEQSRYYSRALGCSVVSLLDSPFSPEYT